MYVELSRKGWLMSWHLEQNPNDVNGGKVQLPDGQCGCISSSES